MKKKIIIPIGIMLIAILLFVGLQVYLSKQSFRYYYHGILLPVSPQRQMIIKEKLDSALQNGYAMSKSLWEDIEESKKYGCCIICSMDSDYFGGISGCVMLDKEGKILSAYGSRMWTDLIFGDVRGGMELVAYLGWWKDASWWPYETPSGISPDLQAVIFVVAELLGIIILFRKKIIKNKKVRKLVTGCTIAVMVIAGCTYVYGKLYSYPIYNELKVLNAPSEKKVVVKEYFYRYGWRMRQYYVEVFPGILRKASDVYDNPIEWMSFTEGDYLARWNEEEQRIEIGLKEKGSDIYDYHEYVTYP